MPIRNLKVMKFGGSSVGDGECLRRAARIIKSSLRDSSLVVVVSAMNGVTNRLIAAARQAASDPFAPAELAKWLRERHLGVIGEVINDEGRRTRLATQLDSIIDETENICGEISSLPELTPRTLDAMAGAGERLSALLLAAALNDLGLQSIAVEATQLIVTNDEYGRAEPLMIPTRVRTRERLLPLISERIIPVVTGFIGATGDGIKTTLGRGGSDYSATIIGAVLGSKEVIIWTDVDGILSADPRLVPTARLLPALSYREATAMALFGAKVLHPQTMQPITELGIPIRIRNSFAPEKSGTLISSKKHRGQYGVKAIAVFDDASLIIIKRRTRAGISKIVAEIVTVLKKERVRILHTLSLSPNSKTGLIVNSVDTGPATVTVQQWVDDHLPLYEGVEIIVNPEVSVIAVVVDQMPGQPSILRRILTVLSLERINVIAVSQQPSECKIIFVVETSMLKKAVLAVHQECHPPSTKGT